TGDFNTAGGSWALYDNTTGSYNTASGDYALSHNTTGNFNTAVGAYVSVKETDLSNATAIGYLATATSSNQVKIGNGSVTSIGGFADWTNFSDKRAKKNIRTDVPGLVFINRLQPVTYNLDLDAVDGLLKIDQTKKSGRDEVEQPMSQELIALDKKAREAKEKQVQTGFVAQDVEEVAQSIGYDFSGVDVDETGIYGLRYAEFVVPLVKAVQELSEQNDRLQAQVNELTELVSGLLGEEPESGALRSKSAVEPASGLQDVAGSGVSLQQNIPNPFHQSTVIRYTLPPTGQQAQMVITGASGRVIRKIPLSASDGPGSITIEGGALAAGIYYYSLYIGNSLVDTKKMILTK
ncbi:MAG: tail fiber domain-containing protein, partial [Dysgonamonadaceae bacterium]|nr:tail fiber domain-containing protein [Dysgonamonadaceae bacterium]